MNNGHLHLEFEMPQSLLRAALRAPYRGLKGCDGGVLSNEWRSRALSSSHD